MVDGDGAGGCSVSGNTATCPSTTGYAFNLGSGDDSATVSGVPGSGSGGDGADKLSGGELADSLDGGARRRDRRRCWHDTLTALQATTPSAATLARTLSTAATTTRSPVETTKTCWSAARATTCLAAAR